jgi:copper chaperone CopZ
MESYRMMRGEEEGSTVTVTTTIALSDIHCASCENTIRTALSQVPGVLQVTPSAATNQVRVSYDEQSVNEIELRSALVSVGYEPVD